LPPQQQFLPFNSGPIFGSSQAFSLPPSQYHGFGQLSFPAPALPAPFASQSLAPQPAGAITQISPPTPVYKHVSTVVQYTNNNNSEFAANAPVGSVRQAVTSSKFLPSAPLLNSSQFNFPPPALTHQFGQPFASHNFQPQAFTSQYNQFPAPASFLTNGSINFGSGSTSYANANASQAHASNVVNNNSQQADSNVFATNASYETVHNPQYGNHFSAAFPSNNSSVNAAPSVSHQGTSVQALPTLTGQTNTSRQQQQSSAPPKQIVVYRPSIHKSARRYTVVA
jgi:hypothetical protein